MDNLRNLTFWVWLFLLLPQASRFRRTAPVFVAPAGPRKGRIPGERVIRVLGIGDSIIEGIGADMPERALVARAARRLGESLGVGVEWEAIGSIGATCDKVALKLLPRLPREHADFIILSVGVNDVVSLKSIRKWVVSLAGLLDSLHAHSPRAVIGIAGIPPLDRFPLLPPALRRLFGFRGRGFDDAARRLSTGHPHVAYLSPDFSKHDVTFSKDGFHPSDRSYGVLAEELVESMLRVSRQAGRLHAR